ncbi:cytochrome c oxidase subunit 6a, mitochondrial [Prunus avium]|uniref:Cytochrome c oxidase subunit 6a, mitochondrial n=2 Tax=Prunus TaxID=3754 RepID=A0A6P5RI10_PRUAV|nr:cytochrome c oxidase subunit 6a, mitochondrial [Prunus avium]
MAMSMVRSAALRTALRGGSRSSAPPKRSFSSSAAHDDAHETAKWEKITYLGIASCTIFAFVVLSKPHPHYDEPPPYPYLHIRNKEFPWGPNGLFEKKHEHH